MKFVMMSDTHYISRSMIADKSDRETLLQVSVVEQALRQAAEEADTILISGDLTDVGDRPSHEEFAALLRQYKEAGKRIFVIFATHDFHHHRAYVRKWGDSPVRFRSAPWDAPYFDPDAANFRDYVTEEFSSLSEEECRPALAETCTPEELWEIYREFGPEQAVSLEETSFSYCVDLDDRTRCLMLNDIFRNEEALHDISPTYTPTCFRWIRQMKDLAAQEGKFLFVCSHHPFMPCSPIHRLGTSNRNLRSPLPGHTLADMGISLAFTGHTHVSALGFLQSAKGNRLCHVSTPSVRFYPPAFKTVELDGQGKRLSYRTVDVLLPAGETIEEATLREHYLREFKKRYFKEYTAVKPPLNRLVAEGRVKDVFFPFRRAAGLTAAEYNALKDRSLFDFLSDIVFNMLTGDGKFTPETPEYRLVMAAAAFADSVIDAQPFVDLRKKSLKGYTLKEVAQALLFKNGISDTEADFDFTAPPPAPAPTPEFHSHAGDILMTVVSVLALPAAALLAPAAALAIPVKTVQKKRRLKKEPTAPLMKY